VEGLSGIEKADALFHNLVAEQKVPGISVTIVRDGKTLLQKGYGFSDLENKVSVDPSRTIFRIASISKCITGLAFGKMVEEGILDWDDSLYKHVPYYPKKGYDFTLRQLASHTAGIRGYRGKEFALNQPFSIKESIKLFKNDPLVFEPGNGYLYNSFDFVLLSLAMEEASGIPFEDYVKEKVLAPLGLTNTFTPCQVEGSRDLLPDKNSNEITTAIGLRCSQFYTKNATGFRKAVNVNNFYKLAGGGYLSTSEDIAKMGQAILNQRLLKKETYEQLLTPQTVHDKSTFYGLGFQVSQDSHGRLFIGHVGNSVGAYTNFFVYPQEKMVISLLANSSNTDIQDFLDSAYSSILVGSIG
jgi:CubicO group peptidase (beta-lactamase class C family)